jgi:hypothetical protein
MVDIRDVKMMEDCLHVGLDGALVLGKDELILSWIY